MNWYKTAQFKNLEGLIQPSDRIVVSKNEEISFRDMSGAQSAEPKPKGLWYGLGTSWLEWMRSEMPHWIKGNIFKLEVNTDVMLMLDTEEKILEFNDEYGIEEYAIMWPSVVLSYGGIEINPYQYKLRLDSRVMWYYGWDVASGCIWGESAFVGATKIVSGIENDPEVKKHKEEVNDWRKSWGGEEIGIDIGEEEDELV